MMGLVGEKMSEHIVAAFGLDTGLTVDGDGAGEIGPRQPIAECKELFIAPALGGIERWRCIEGLLVFPAFGPSVPPSRASI